MATSDPKLRSREERTMLLRDRWSGENKNKVNSNPRPQHENLLEGVLYNAMPRKTAGKPLSKLEERLIDFASQFTEDEAELAEYGQLFQESKQTYKTNMQNLYPNALLSLDEDQPFTGDDFVNYAIDISEEFAALPQNQIVDLAKVQGSYKPSDEYNTAVKQAGSGSLFFDSSAAPSINADMKNEGELIANRFKVWEAPGDVWTGPKAELYFTWSAGADNGSTKKYKTKTWGSIVDGDEYRFPSDNRIFSGSIEYCMFAYISLWEEDDSSSAWVDALIEFTKTASENLMDAAMDTAKSPNRESKKAAVYQALASAVALGLSALISKWRNQDDLVGERTVGFTKAGLGEFWGRPNDEIGFDVSNKMGDVSIYLHGAIHGSNLAKIQWQASSGPSSSWSQPKAVNNDFTSGALSWEGMPIVDFNGILVGCWNNTDSGRIMWSKFNASSESWSQPTEILGHLAFGKVATCVWNGSLWLAYHDAGDHARLIRTNGSDINQWVGHWGDNSLIPGFSFIGIPYYIDLGPAMAALDSKLVIALKIMGITGIYYTVGYRGNNNWKSPSYASDTSSNIAPTLVNFSGDIYLIWVSESNDHIRYNRFKVEDETWYGSSDTELQTSGSVGAFVHAGKLYLAYRSKAKDNYTVKYTPFMKDSQKYLVKDASEQNIQGSSAYSGVHVGSFNNKLFVTYGKPT